MRKRNNEVRIRLNDEEYAKLQKNAEKAPEGFTLGGFFCGLLYERFIFQASAGSV